MDSGITFVPEHWVLQQQTTWMKIFMEKVQSRKINIPYKTVQYFRTNSGMEFMHEQQLSDP